MTVKIFFLIVSSIFLCIATYFYNDNLLLSILVVILTIITLMIIHLYHKDILRFFSNKKESEQEIDLQNILFCRKKIDYLTAYLEKSQSHYQSLFQRVNLQAFPKIQTSHKNTLSSYHSIKSKLQDAQLHLYDMEDALKTNTLIESFEIDIIKHADRIEEIERTLLEEMKYMEKLSQKIESNYFYLNQIA